MIALRSAWVRCDSFVKGKFFVDPVGSELQLASQSGAGFVGLGKYYYQFFVTGLSCYDTYRSLKDVLVL